MTAREAVTGTQDVLDKMTASIMNKKTEARTALTPVGMEVRTAPLGRTTASFPNDDPSDAILQCVSVLEELFGKVAEADETITRLQVQIRAQYADIRKALDAAKAELGAGQPVADPAAAQKAKEKAADVRVAASTAAALEAAAEAATIDETVAAFNASFSAQSAAAQAATFAAAAGPVGWQCPVHHAAAERTSRKGRKFQACPNYPDGCGEFEKLA